MALANVPDSGIRSHVRRRRLAAGLSQQDLAARVGLSRQAIGAIEAGHAIPSTAVALRLARALDCAVEDLFAVDEPRGPLQASLPADAARAAAGDRVAMARVGDRLLARPLTGASALGPADGVVRSCGDDTVEVEPLVDPEVIDRTVVVAGCDPALAVLGAHLARAHPGVRLQWVQSGSLAALQTVRRGEAHLAGSHLYDPETGEDNLPFVRRELRGQAVTVVGFAHWEEGLIVRAGNPKRIDGPSDLGRPDVRIVNREPGSGGRALLDAALRSASIEPPAIRGYRREVPSHVAVAEAVAVGRADVGPGILAVALAYGLGFIPLRSVRYDLVIPTSLRDAPVVQALLDTAASGACRRQIEALGGYDSAPAGTVVAEL